MSFKERLVEEREQLAERLQKLTSFVGGEVYQGLQPADRALLDRQHQIMEDYLSVLDVRISRI